MEYINAMPSGSLAFSLGYVRIIVTQIPVMPGRHPERLKNTFVAGGPVGLVEGQPVPDRKKNRLPMNSSERSPADLYRALPGCRNPWPASPGSERQSPVSKAIRSGRKAFGVQPAGGLNSGDRPLPSASHVCRGEVRSPLDAVFTHVRIHPSLPRLRPWSWGHARD
jgi:hypothetical protein